MVNNSPVAVAHRSSTLSILWGVLLIIFGMMAIGSPMLAAVAVNVVIAWLIVLAGDSPYRSCFSPAGGGQRDLEAARRSCVSAVSVDTCCCIRCSG